MVFITCCMERGLCVGFRLPLQTASSYNKLKAANGIQRYCGKLAVADATYINKY